MNNALKQLEQTLRDAGYSLTKPRTVVFRAIMDHGPLTVAELSLLVEDHVNRASIYRIIKLFELLGVIERLAIGWKYKLELSDHFNPHHHHISCTVCGNIQPLPDNSRIEEQLKLMAAAAHYDLTSHQLELRGTCPTCTPKSLDM